DAAVKLSQPDIHEATEHALARFGAFLEPNPRGMKLFVNTYGLLRSLRTLEEVFVDSGPLALWAIVEIRWPRLADYLRAHPEAARIDDARPAVPNDIKVLLGVPEVTAVLQDPAAGPLTPDLIRKCSGMDSRPTPRSPSDQEPWAMSQRT